MSEVERFESKFEPVTESGCWIWVGACTGNGYGSFWMSPGYQAAHRVSFEMYNRALEGKEMVLHKCDTPLCVNPDHLFVGTHADNMADRQAKKRHAFGGRNAGAKINESDAIDIRLSSLPTAVLMKKYGISKSTVCRIKAKKLWSYI